MTLFFLTDYPHCDLLTINSRGVGLLRATAKEGKGVGLLRATAKEGKGVGLLRATAKEELPETCL